jgi:hypothetical protein
MRGGSRVDRRRGAHADGHGLALAARLQILQRAGRVAVYLRRLDVSGV